MGSRNCNCNGGGCGGNGRVFDMIGGRPIQQGDTFSLLFQYKEDDTPMDLPEGYDLLVAIYDIKNRPIKVGKVSDGSIVTNLPTEQGQTKTYSLPITHSDSMKMLGKVELEVTIKSTDNSVIDHARQIVTIVFEQRRNNALL